MVEHKIKRSLSLASYVAMVSLAILIFILGSLFGNWIAGLGFKEVQREQLGFSTSLIGLELREDLLEGEDICSISVKDILEEKTELGVRLEALEKRLGKENKEVLLQKEIYSLISLRTLLLFEEAKEKCNLDDTILLFFYTNRKDDPAGSIGQSEDQGYLLTAFSDRHEDENYTIFAFDYNVDNPAIDTLKVKYSVSAVPSIVYGGKTYLGYQSAGALEGIRESNLN